MWTNSKMSWIVLATIHQPFTVLRTNEIRWLKSPNNIGSLSVCVTLCSITLSSCESSSVGDKKVQFLLDQSNIVKHCHPVYVCVACCWEVMSQGANWLYNLHACERIQLGMNCVYLRLYAACYTARCKHVSTNLYSLSISSSDGVNTAVGKHCEG